MTIKKYGIGMIVSLFAFAFCTLVSCSDDDETATPLVEWEVTDNSGSISVDFKPGEHYNDIQFTVEPEGGQIALVATNWASFEMTGFRVNGEYSYDATDSDGNVKPTVVKVENVYVSPEDFEKEIEPGKENLAVNQGATLMKKLCKAVVSSGKNISFEFGPMEAGVSGNFKAYVLNGKQMSDIIVVRK